jgi:hypothetical protein
MNDDSEEHHERTHQDQINPRRPYNKEPKISAVKEVEGNVNYMYIRSPSHRCHNIH